MRYVCAERECVRAGVAVTETICAACGARTRAAAPAARAGVPRRMALVAAVTAVPWFLAAVAPGLVVLTVAGALAAWWTTQRSKDEGRPTPFFWVAFAGALALSPVLVALLRGPFFLVPGILDYSP